MKKFFLPLLIVISAITYGCSFSDNFKDEPEFSAMMGVLTKQEANDEYAGTHLITDDQKQITPVRSLSINLDRKEYFGNKVEALGVLNPDDGVFEITGISVKEVLIKTIIEKKLQEYKNTEFGFELKYYDTWDLAEQSDGIVLTSTPSTETSTDFASVEIKQIPFSYSPKTNEDGTTDTPLDAYFNEAYGSSADLGINKIGVDMLSSAKLTNSDGSVSYILYRAGLIYKITYTPSKESSIQDKIDFQEMITEFRFIGINTDDEAVNGIDSADEVSGADEDTDVVSDLSSDSSLYPDKELTSFESLPYHFMGKYPKDWYYAGKIGTGPGVLHHYGFSDESVTDGNEAIGLDVISDAIPSGEKINVLGKELTVIQQGSKYIIYISADGQNYRIEGDKQYKDLMTAMAANISPAIKDEE
ncbi:hypothetical protein A3B60_00310 [Candidatus Peregrinibacteria bacterium RIFCSPLOWO2_01_FULL_39_12]|nr:MAG: hypothetical protein A3I58_00060 [Candidatus Peregrinibacteria bacterium RIFCSPLOWO2_02_FULL_39_10]OGJ42228.1 MAG: hypothetical protein A3B60_00310 [Candidatus Peregrinibacteria bacterium RIFCSPLOWO2_01_FULL_39_12]